jgi:hypothetical protein
LKTGASVKAFGFFGCPARPVQQMATMGTKTRDVASLPPVSLNDLVPPHQFYRHLERSLDHGFVRDLVRDSSVPRHCS